MKKKTKKLRRKSFVIQKVFLTDKFLMILNLFFFFFGCLSAKKKIILIYICLILLFLHQILARFAFDWFSFISISFAIFFSTNQASLFLSLLLHGLLFIRWPCGLYAHHMHEQACGLKVCQLYDKSVILVLVNYPKKNFLELPLRVSTCWSWVGFVPNSWLTQ